MDGCFVCLLGPIAFDIVGAQNASQAMGFLLAMISVPLMMGPMIGGKFNDGREASLMREGGGVSLMIGWGGKSSDGGGGKSNDGREEVSLMIEDKYMWECNQEKV